MKINYIILYIDLCNIFTRVNPHAHFKWATYIKFIFDECGLIFIWNDLIPLNRELLKSIDKQFRTYFVDLSKLSFP